MAVVQQRPGSAAGATLVLAEKDGAPRPARPAWLYTAALHPADEPQRLAELRGFGILDTEPDEDYDRLVQLAGIGSTPGRHRQAHRDDRHR